MQLKRCALVLSDECLERSSRVVLGVTHLMRTEYFHIVSHPKTRKLTYLLAQRFKGTWVRWKLKLLEQSTSTGFVAVNHLRVPLGGPRISKSRCKG